jgi:hypothetical protein
MRILVAALIAAAALGGGLLVGATQFGDKGEGTSQRPAPVQSNPQSAAEAKRQADCRRDALSDRSADDSQEALANDGCLGDSSENDPTSGDNPDSTDPTVEDDLDDSQDDSR